MKDVRIETNDGYVNDYVNTVTDEVITEQEYIFVEYDSIFDTGQTLDSVRLDCRSN